MQAIPACTICGAPTLDRWCADCHDRMEAAYADAQAEQLALWAEEHPPTGPVNHDLF